MRAPLSFAYGNLLFGSSMQDAWALFSVPAHPYAGLSAQGKHEQLGRMAGALDAAGADVQLLRVGRAWARERYLSQQREMPTPHRAALDAYLDDQGEAISEVGGARPWCGIAVRLAEPQRDLTTMVEQLSERPPRQWWRSVRETIAWNDRRLLRATELERLRVAADQVHARPRVDRLAGFAPCDHLSTGSPSLRFGSLSVAADTLVPPCRRLTY